jgi:hypothetical protein
MIGSKVNAMGEPPRPSSAAVDAQLPRCEPGAPLAPEQPTAPLIARAACPPLNSDAPAISPERLSASPAEWQAGRDKGDYDYDAASEALEGPFDRNREKQLQKQEAELRLLHRMNGLTIRFHDWIADCGVDLRHLYICERREPPTARCESNRCVLP